MKFKVERTSDIWNDKQPCPEAIRETIGAYDVPTIDWFVNIDTLEELVAFAKEHGPELVFEDGRIEIYDTYRE